MRGIVRFIRTACSFRPTVIYVVETAYTGVVAVCFTRLITRCRWVLDTGDVAYALARSTGIYNIAQLCLIWAVEEIGIRTADIVVVRGSFHRDLLTSRGVAAVEFIPDGISSEALAPSPQPQPRQEFSGGNALVLGLIGSMIWSPRYQMCYGWDVVEAMPLLSDLPVVALLVGDGDGRARLEERARELGVDRKIEFAGRREGEELQHFLQKMHVCISTQSNDVVGMVRTTGKLPLYLAAERCVVATDVGEASRVLPGIGYLLPYRGVKDPMHPARLAHLVRQLACGEADLHLGRGFRRETALREFSYEILGQKVKDICMRLSNGSNSGDN